DYEFGWDEASSQNGYRMLKGVDVKQYAVSIDGSDPKFPIARWPGGMQKPCDMICLRGRPIGRS
ncbi:unnamed protein product, partial [Prorocentrum cordatum]